MFRYGKRSLNNLSECHPDLQLVFYEVIKHRDCSIIEGHRGESEQNYLKKIGRSHLAWPDSSHNKLPSWGIDAVSFPIVWTDIQRFKEFCWFVKGVAAGMGIPLISGGLDWKSFRDYAHFQLLKSL